MNKQSKEFWTMKEFPLEERWNSFCSFSRLVYKNLFEVDRKFKNKILKKKIESLCDCGGEFHNKTICFEDIVDNLESDLEDDPETSKYTKEQIDEFKEAILEHGYKGFILGL